MNPSNNKKYGKNFEKKFLEDEIPSYDNHPEGSLNIAISPNKQMKGAINYNPQVGYFYPSAHGSSDEIEYFKSDLEYNINWQNRCRGLPGSRP